MRKNRLYLLAVLTLGLPILLWVAALIRFYYSIQQLRSNIYYPFLMERFTSALSNPWVIFFLILILGEIAIYYLIRRKIYYPAFVFFHTGMSLIAFVIFPFMAGLFDQNPFVEHRSVTILQFRLLFWLPLILGHLFFLFTIIHSFRKTNSTPSNETPGILDEFANWKKRV